MTKDEIKQLLAFMASVYTARLMPEINSFTVEVWHRILGDLDFSITKKALMKWVSIEKYPPTPADIRGIIADSRMVNKLTSEEAWRLIMDAVRKYGYTSKDEALQSLPDTVRTIVRRFGWDYFCQMPIEDTSTYYAQFRNAYAAIVLKEKESLQIPDSLKQIGGSEKLAITD